MQGLFTFMGTGASTGVPVVGCSCAICKSTSPLNRRKRSSAWIQIGVKSYLIDIGPDFHSQALERGLKQLDALILTHTHYDHIAGIDELRVFYFLEKKPIKVVLSKSSYEELEKRYYYLFPNPHESHSESARFDFEVLPENSHEVLLDNWKLKHIQYHQGNMPVTGYRLGNIAYVTDIKEYDEKIFNWLEGVDILITSALRWTPSKVHFNVDEAVAFAKRSKVKQTYLMHIAHDLDHEATNELLPPDIRLAYDGLSIPFFCESVK